MTFQRRVAIRLCIGLLVLMAVYYHFHDSNEAAMLLAIIAAVGWAANLEPRSSVMARKTKVYKAHVFTSKGERLIRAGSKTQAILHIAAELIKVELASVDDAHELASRGVKIEDAKAVEPEASE